MTKRINRVIELFEDDQPVYYTGLHSFDRDYLTYEQGKKDASIWADYINIGMEHGAFDMGGLEAYMDGLVDGGPTPSGHVTPTVIVELPVQGESADIIRYNAWQIRQILARGVHGILLCEATTPDAVAAFVESCRYKINEIGVGFGLKDGTRGVGSEFKAKEKWGLSDDNDYRSKADPWPLNPNGEILLGLKIETLAGLNNCEQILSVPGIGFAEMGPGDMSMSMKIKRVPGSPPDPRIKEASARVKKACDKNGIKFLESANPGNITEIIDTGARVIAGQSEEAAQIGRKYTGRQMKV
ncbi:MAG: aldolase/citrate lyase family protein [SAR202 cluster bacterium]|jgi:4-hydroxy-2-oxoheptanedioate aldolase|nr:aldolase/citrate lyase family protein [SAR202 cluster bacterium]|tara:strand:+ start:197 stop:1090 length:894 start_codon:yes stop_codon:yes gene_type:complete